MKFAFTVQLLSVVSVLAAAAEQNDDVLMVNDQARELAGGRCPAGCSGRGEGGNRGRKGGRGVVDVTCCESLPFFSGVERTCIGRFNTGMSISRIVVGDDVNTPQPEETPEPEEPPVPEEEPVPEQRPPSKVPLTGTTWCCPLDCSQVAGCKGPFKLGRGRDLEYDYSGATGVPGGLCNDRLKGYNDWPFYEVVVPAPGRPDRGRVSDLQIWCCPDIAGEKY